jgi:hypothetical protein
MKWVRTNNQSRVGGCCCHETRFSQSVGETMLEKMPVKWLFHYSLFSWYLALLHFWIDIGLVVAVYFG